MLHLRKALPMLRCSLRQHVEEHSNICHCIGLKSGSRGRWKIFSETQVCCKPKSRIWPKMCFNIVFGERKGGVFCTLSLDSFYHSHLCLLRQRAALLFVLLLFWLAFCTADVSLPGCPAVHLDWCTLSLSKIAVFSLIQSRGPKPFCPFRPVGILHGY